MKGHILIVEDDRDIAELLQFNLENEGYRVNLETHGERAYEKIVAEPPDLLILDLNLPGLTGIEICKYLRENARTRDLPIMMLTARTQEIDKIIGFEIGADDYITKPFSIREVLARVKALLRRAKPASNDVFQRAGFQINFNQHRVLVEEAEVELTPTEYKLLVTLVRGKGRVLSRDDLLELVWGMDYYGEIRTVDVHIKRLRDKLGPAAALIETVKGVGYRFKIE